MHPLHAFQSKYLDSLIADQKPAALYFKDGYRIMGKVMGVTDKVVFFKHGITECIYKNHISSIIPILEYRV